MDLLDKGVDQKKIQFGEFNFGRFFKGQAKQKVSSDAEKGFSKYMRTSSDISSFQGEMASTRGIYNDVMGGEFVGDDGSLLSLQPWIFKREGCLKLIEESSDSSSRWSFDWIGFSRTSHGSPRRICTGSHLSAPKKRRQDENNLKPISFAESIFMPTLCSENVGVEEYNFNFGSSLSVTDDGLARIPRRTNPRSGEANRMKVDSSVEQIEKRCDDEFGSLLSSEKVCIDRYVCSISGKLNTMVGIPHLPVRRLKKVERKSTETIPENLDASISQNMFKLSNPIDSHNRMFLFLFGVAIGVTFNIVSLRMEVEKLNKLVKDNKNLIQDLHDEIEMKDSLTLKELVIGTDGNKELEHINLEKSIDATQNSNWNAAALKSNGCDNLSMSNIDLSEIEAELEAELERLEQNINASRSACDFIELDSDLIADVVSGELREDLLIKTDTDDDDKNTATASTTHAYSANYSVSPKELTLRLHKVIQSRLEERIKELEIELERTQVKLKLAEAERLSPSKPPFTCSEANSSNHCSPKSLEQESSSPRLDLSGDALVAYDEAYEEFLRLDDTEDEKVPCSLSSGDKNVREDGENEEACEQILWRTGSYDISATDEEDDDSFDEGNDLIQKILEKTRKGSPALLNAQKMLSSMDW